MITVYGEGRGFRVVWLIEEMGLPYRLRPVDLIAGVEKDAEFLSVNPSGFIPALRDGDVTMVESIAIMEYLIARYGRDSKIPLAPAPQDPAFPLYLQFLQMGEASLAGTIQSVVVSRNFAPEAERNNWGAGWSLNQFTRQLAHVTRRLAQAPYMAGDTFTAADISVAYALMLARGGAGIVLGEAEQAYMARTFARDGYKRAVETCQAVKEWLVRTSALPSP
jgi:glutathione S-transferase